MQKNRRSELICVTASSQWVQGEGFVSETLEFTNSFSRILVRLIVIRFAPRSFGVCDLTQRFRDKRTWSERPASGCNRMDAIVVSTPPASLGFRVWGSGFSVQGSGFRVQGSGFSSNRNMSNIIFINEDY